MAVHQSFLSAEIPLVFTSLLQCFPPVLSCQPFTTQSPSSIKLSLDPYSSSPALTYSNPSYHHVLIRSLSLISCMLAWERKGTLEKYLKRKQMTERLTQRAVHQKLVEGKGASGSGTDTFRMPH